MLHRILFSLLLIPVTIYYSIKMLLVDSARSTQEQEDAPALQWGRQLIRLGGLRIDADLSSIEPGGHYVLIGNHQSNLDIPILDAVFLEKDVHIRFVAKQSLFDIPLFGKAMARAGHISIDRGNRRAAMKSLAAAVDQIKGGISPVIFPEGTRNTNLDEFLEFKSGGVILALKSGLPVVPFVMVNTGRVMPKGGRFLDNRHTIRIKTLPVIDSSAYTLKERDKFKDDLREMMMTAYREMRNEEK
ncbi:lysophospholipid acyltransferase family protein [Pseudodesulfovibrio tunisiensis]|uniref:lysophospholipid acyltransferase family protein n=1 Tax=Pseudodesulfovibrio tunisiensis TaxID=463192 RepID=UPI001FB247C7|nr:lysophospholipid acyltransferase family protein [Pseudodesulfovibrio tunisiensis]